MAFEEQIIQAIRVAVSSTVQAVTTDLAALRSGGGKGDVEQIVNRIETFNSENFQDWKFQLKMAVQGTNLNGYKYLQGRETSRDSRTS